MDAKTLVKTSKHLSKVLRHDPGSVGLTLDAAGWVSVSNLLSAMRLSMENLEQVVEDNNKKRFEFNEDKTRIRASQGHSVDVDLGYEAKVPPETLFHGTSTDLIPILYKEGLKKMGRHHVHLSVDFPTAQVVARRRPNPIVITVLAGEMHRKGFEFYLSTNGVWLTDIVPINFLMPTREH